MKRHWRCHSKSRIKSKRQTKKSITFKFNPYSESQNACNDENTETSDSFNKPLEKKEEEEVQEKSPEKPKELTKHEETQEDSQTEFEIQKEASPVKEITSK